MASGGAGTDVKSTLAYESMTDTLSSDGTARAMAFGVSPSERLVSARGARDGQRPSISIDALKARKGVVEKLLAQGNALLKTAQDGFTVGASCSGDCDGMQALQSWIRRLVAEDERLRLEIAGFKPGRGQ